MWYDEEGYRCGIGPKAFERATRPKGADYSPEFEFFSGENIGERPKKKGPGRPKKKREALKQLNRENSDE
jgi:hypothetical protein